MKVYRRLQKLLLCVSHQHSLRCIDELGEGYDDEVMEWKRELEESVGLPLLNRKWWKWL